jgi:hypothetical protein
MNACSVGQAFGSGREPVLAFSGHWIAPQAALAETVVVIDDSAIGAANFQKTFQEQLRVGMIVIILVKQQMASGVEVEQSFHRLHVFDGVMIQLASQLKKRNEAVSVQESRSPPASTENAGD